MENKKKAKVDYAAIIREFEMYGRGRSLKQFCDDSSYVYPNAVMKGSASIKAVTRGDVG